MQHHEPALVVRDVRLSSRRMRNMQPWQRRLRELVRIELLPVLSDRPSTDIAIRARRESYAAEFSALRNDIVSVRARLVDAESGM